MNKTLTVYLILLGIITYVHAADINVNVGGPNGENIFSPNTVFASAGDNIVFTWISGKHSIIESDAAKACTKSLKPNAFTSGGAFKAPKTWTLPLSDDIIGKTWFYCGVPPHCVLDGMYGTIIIDDPSGKAPTTNPGKAPPNPGKAPPNPKVTPNPPNIGKAVPSSGNNTNNTPILVGAIIGALIGGILLTIGSFFLYKMFKRNKTNKDIMLIPGDNRNNKDVILIPGNNETYENKNKFHSDSNTEVYNDEQETNHEQEANYGQEANHGREANHGQEANYGQEANHGREANHGQEAISIPENNDASNLKNYITQIVRQELKQNQK